MGRVIIGMRDGRRVPVRAEDLGGAILGLGLGFWSGRSAFRTEPVSPGWAGT